ncbi:thrombospondin type 3 repeat-containing protein [Candidatus Woesearchaeota archaeon]|nr:thrombospondin type 3 repeat-containing protein [Candidatus Woesearchaeota archaeon]
MSMRSRRGVTWTQWTMISLIMAVIIIILFVLMMQRQSEMQDAWLRKQTCKTSVIANAATRIPGLVSLDSDLKCPAGEVVIDYADQDRIKERVALSMYHCYDKFLRGRHELFATKSGQQELYCVFCDRIGFEGPAASVGEVPEFTRYLLTHKIPKESGLDLLYSTYLSGYQVRPDEEYILPKPLEDLDVDADGIPNDRDTDNDNDGIPDSMDTCPRVRNPQQEDADGDRIGDACDPDRTTINTLPPTDAPLSDSIYTDRDYGVVFFYAKNSDWWNMYNGFGFGAAGGGVLVSGTLVAIGASGGTLLIAGTVIGAISGGAIGAYLGGDPDIRWSAGVMLVPWETDYLDQLQCTYLPAEQEGADDGSDS